LDGSPSIGPLNGGGIIVGPVPAAPLPEAPEPPLLDMPDVPEPPDVPAFMGVAIVPDVGIAIVPAIELFGGCEPVPELPAGGELAPPFMPGGALGPPPSIVPSAQPTKASAAERHAAPVRVPFRPMAPPPARVPSQNASSWCASYVHPPTSILTKSLRNPDSGAAMGSGVPGFGAGNGIRKRADDQESRGSIESPHEHDNARPSSSPVVAGVGQSVGNQPDPVEVALADALTRASAAGEWTTVALLARELEARRTARASAIDLAAERSARRRP
jgi:hypothetical protein